MVDDSFLEVRCGISRVLNVRPLSVHPTIDQILHDMDNLPEPEK